MAKNTRTELTRLLQERNEYPERKAEIDQKIQDIFTQTHAILVLDMSGFSKTTIRYGIIHFLAMVHRMKTIVVPEIEKAGGTVIKQEADNIFAVFPEVKPALEASLDMLKVTSAANTMLRDEMDIYLCVGIGYGEVLMVDDEDMYGAELNLASKLGEDLAQRGEILLTESAFENLANTETELEKLEFSISGLELIAYKAQPAPASV